MISVPDIEARLRDRVEALARELLPAAVREGPYLQVGSLSGEAGQSLKINLQGHNQGRWRDYAGDDHGDMLDLIAAVQGFDTKGAAVAWAKAWLGIVDDWSPKDAPRPNPEELARRAADARARAQAQAEKAAAERAAKIKGAKALFLSGMAIADRPAAHYLRGRGLDMGPLDSWPGSLRYHPEVWNRALGVKIPALLAMAVNANGQHRATHRIYLQNCAQRGWTKIDRDDAKMVLGPIGGAFVPINKGASGKSMRDMDPQESIYMTEGIEDAIAVRMALPSARIICGITLGNLGAIILPKHAQRLVIVADRDTKTKAVDALERSIARHQARRLKVQLVMPPLGCKDFNDWLLANMRAIPGPGPNGAMAA